MKEIKLTLSTAFITYILAVILLPPLCCLLIFYVLYFIEERALPWLTFILGPLFSVILILMFGFWILRATKDLNDKQTKILKIFIYSSIIWGSFLVVKIFPMLIAVLS